MDFEAKIASFATGLLILASYIALFDFWDHTGFLVAVALITLLLVAFRDFHVTKSIILKVIFASLLALFFWRYLQNPIYLPLAALLIVGMLALGAKLETVVPALTGLLVIIFIDPEFLVSGIITIFQGLAPLFGIHSALDSFGYLHLYHTRSHLPIFIDGIKMLLPFYFALLVAQVVLLLLTETDRKTILKSVPVALVLPLVFPLLTLVNVIFTPVPASFIPDNWPTLLFPLVCITILAAWTPGAKLRKLERPTTTGSASSKQATLVTCVLLIAFFVLAITYFTPVTTRSDPILIIDESHSEWEPSWTDYVQAYEIDPVSGSNNYYGLLNLLSSLYDTTLLIDRPEKVPAVSATKTVLIDEISLQTLRDIARGRKGVLILKCVTKPYSQSEVDAILQFLAEGNGLLLISEHTNLYDMGTNLNPIAEQLGYHYQPNGIQDVYSDTRGTITHRGEFPAFIARFLTGNYHWETGCGMEKLQGKYTLFELRSSPSHYAHYENETAPFYLNRVFTDDLKLNCQFHRFLTFSGVQYGDGKALVWTDSTPFNNGLIGSGEHAQFFVGMVEYISSNDRFNKVFLPFLLLAIALLVLAVNRKRPLKIFVLLLLLLFISFNLAYPLAQYTVAFPELKTAPTAIGMVVEDYHELYFSAALDTSELLEPYYYQGFTGIIFQEPSEDWFSICHAIEELPV
ncbi:MAG: hypothetical protein ACP5E9_09205 [Candidatus Methanospirareceae archaeon]